MANSDYTYEDIDNEIKKCRLLCAACHRIETGNTYGWFKFL
jgi:hypothetical protein